MNSWRDRSGRRAKDEEDDHESDDDQDQTPGEDLADPHTAFALPRVGLIQLCRSLAHLCPLSLR